MTLTLDQKKIYIRDFLDNMKLTFLEEAEAMPQGWDGVELRTCIASAFQQEAVPMDLPRARAFDTARLNAPLKY